MFLLWATPYVSASYVKTNDRADARIDTRAVNRSRPAAVGIDFRLSSSTNLDLSANDNTVRFDADATFEGTPLRSALDRNTRIYRATLRYAVDAGPKVSFGPVTVSGVRRDWMLDEGGCRHYSMEINYCSFSRTIELPDDLQGARVAVDYRDGILSVRIAQREESDKKE